jgi:hypothetical protein
MNQSHQTVAANSAGAFDPAAGSFVIGTEELRRIAKMELGYDPGHHEAEFKFARAAIAEALRRISGPSLTEAAVQDLIHFSRQRWQGDFTYTAEEVVARWRAGEFPYDAAEQVSEQCPGAGAGAPPEAALLEYWASHRSLIAARRQHEAARAELVSGIVNPYNVPEERRELITLRNQTLRNIADSARAVRDAAESRFDAASIAISAGQAPTQQSGSAPQLCDLGPSGAVVTPALIRAWVAAAAARIRAADMSPFKARVWAYRKGGANLIACDIDGDNKTGVSITFVLGRPHDFDPGQPNVPDGAEALHMIALLAGELGATTDIGRPSMRAERAGQ